MGIQDMLRRMIEVNASDLHLKVASRPVLRINGQLVVGEDMPVQTPKSLEEIFAAIATLEQQEALQREKELDFAYSVPDLARFRVNACWQRGTLSLAFRSVHWKIPSIAELGLPEICALLVLKPRGLVLVTGPTGSGKSTTLAAMVQHLNKNRRCRVVTIEDPIEYLHQDEQCIITQRELGMDTLSFADALKHVLRQDPDVIMVGEMRDLETIGAALTAAETGHLVLATLHTTSAAQTIDRIIDVFPPYQQQQVRVQLSTTLEAVLCQTLIPRLDREGRVAAVEVMVATSAIRNLIREGKTPQMYSVIQTGAQFGMQTLDQALRSLCQRRLISLEDALARAVNPEELRRQMSYA
ncbi:MAG: type IV pilus twitching motility protein PilT [Chloroflexota bacterium]